MGIMITKIIIMRIIYKLIKGIIKMEKQISSSEASI